MSENQFRIAVVSLLADFVVIYLVISFITIDNNRYLFTSDYHIFDTRTGIVYRGTAKYSGDKTTFVPISYPIHSGNE